VLDFVSKAAQFTVNQDFGLSKNRPEPVLNTVSGPDIICSTIEDLSCPNVLSFIGIASAGCGSNCSDQGDGRDSSKAREMHPGEHLPF
jgi:hypothetical protein